MRLKVKKVKGSADSREEIANSSSETKMTENEKEKKELCHNVNIFNFMTLQIVWNP